MRVLLAALIIGSMVSVVAVFAQSSDAGTGTSECSGDISVSPPTGVLVTAQWEMSGSGRISAANITWAPTVNSDYTIAVTLGESSGLRSFTNSGTDFRTDRVPLSLEADPQLTTSAVIAITDNAAPTGSLANVGWLLTSTGEVTAVQVSWIPGRSAAYTLDVTLEQSTGSLWIANSGTSRRNDSVPLSPPVAAGAATKASLCITEAL